MEEVAGGFFASFEEGFDACPSCDDTNEAGEAGGEEVGIDDALYAHELEVPEDENGYNEQGLVDEPDIEQAVEPLFCLLDAGGYEVGEGAYVADACPFEEELEAFVFDVGQEEHEWEGEEEQYACDATSDEPGGACDGGGSVFAGARVELDEGCG